MWYGYEYREDGRWNVYKVEGGKLEVLLIVKELEKAERAEELYDKYGHGALRYPRK